MIPFLYPLVCLALGTVSGAVSWWRAAVLQACVVIVLAAAFAAARRRQEWLKAGGLFEPALAVLFVAMAMGALASPCGAGSWRMLLMMAAGAAIFYFVI